MKNVILVLCSIFGLLSACNDSNDEPVGPQEMEVTLFDKETKAVAYIDYSDSDSTIYMWDGTPVCYLKNKNEIYHFQGQFLGWYVEGVVYDVDGYAVVARKGVVRGEIMMEDIYAASTLKGIQQICPIPHVRSLPSARPVFKNEWSDRARVLDCFFLLEVTLFDKDKKAIVYIDYAEDFSIYMWNGTPVAYVVNEEEIYHFDGRFLGWYVDGVLYDAKGYVVAAAEGVQKGEISMIIPQMEPMKGVQSVPPIKKARVVAPIRPRFELRWSEMSLTDFFLSE